VHELHINGPAYLEQYVTSIHLWTFSLGSLCGFVLDVDTGQAFCYFPALEIFFSADVPWYLYHRLSPCVSIYSFPGTWSKCCTWCLVWAVSVSQHRISTNVILENLTYEVFFKKVKFTPEGPQGEWRYSCTLSLTSMLDGGGWSMSPPGHFTSGKDTRYPLYRRLSGPQGQFGGVRKISTALGFDPRTIHS